MMMIVGTGLWHLCRGVADAIEPYAAMEAKCDANEYHAHRHRNQ